MYQMYHKQMNIGYEFGKAIGATFSIGFSYSILILLVLVLVMVYQMS